MVDVKLAEVELLVNVLVDVCVSDREVVDGVLVPVALVVAVELVAVLDVVLLPVLVVSVRVAVEEPQFLSVGVRSSSSPSQKETHLKLDQRMTFLSPHLASGQSP